MTIRVLHLIGSLRLGGAQVCLKQLVEHNPDPAIEHIIYPLRPRQVDIPIAGNIIHLPYANYDIRKFFAILKICRDRHIDIIHAHLHKPILGALLATFFCNVKVVVHEHGPIFRRGIQYTFYRLALALLKNRASIVIANSQATANRLVQKCRIPISKIRVIYNAVDIDAFQENPKIRKAVRRRFGFSDEDLVIGFVGRLHQVKGVDLLVRAIPLLVPKRPCLKFLFVGEGPLRNDLKKQILKDGTASQVCFAGFQKNVSEIMNAFDIGCMPSRQEAFGIAALEMMCMKIPLVCSSTEGLGEIVEDGKTALILNSNTPSEIANCLTRLIGDPVLCSRLSEKAFESVLAFDVSVMTDRFNSVYKFLIQH